jgi:hypothetical protein
VVDEVEALAVEAVLEAPEAAKGAVLVRLLRAVGVEAATREA